MALCLPNIPQPMRQWRFNSTLLSDSEFVRFIEQKISFFFETNTTPDVSALVIWDALKAYLRGEIIAFTANKKRLSQKEQLDLTSKIKEIDQQYAHTQTPELYNKHLELKTRFDLLTTYQTQNILLKNKSNYYEHGEKCGKLLASQLKRQRAKQLIKIINTRSGEVTVDHTKINYTF